MQKHHLITSLRYVPALPVEWQICVMYTNYYSNTDPYIEKHVFKLLAITAPGGFLLFIKKVAEYSFFLYQIFIIGVKGGWTQKKKTWGPHMMQTKLFRSDINLKGNY